MSLMDAMRMLAEGRTADEFFEAYARSKKSEIPLRAAEFSSFGVAPDSVAPAAEVYHRYSSTNPGFWPLMTLDEAEVFTLNRDYRYYPDAPRVTLPPASLGTAVSLEEAIRHRRSTRNFSDEPLKLAELATLLGLACGVTDTRAVSVPHRAYPSGGALYPVEVYPIVLGVEGLEPAVCHYATLDHALERLRPITADEVRRGFPDLIPGTQLMFVLTISFPRAYGKYGERGYRFSMLETGHLAQNIVLVAAGLGLKSLCMGGFFDNDTNTLLQLDPEREAAVYGILTGRARVPST